jgi:hypothetical protein
MSVKNLPNTVRCFKKNVKHTLTLYLPETCNVRLPPSPAIEGRHSYLNPPTLIKKKI